MKTTLKIGFTLLVGVLVSQTLPAQQPNILLVIADDLGVEATPGYAAGAEKALMPNLQALAAAGVTFDNVWSNPLCSPTRASILTGKYGVRTGVVNVDELSKISAGEKTIQEFLAEATNDAYASAIIGKWHLSGRNNPDLAYPETVGVPHYAGLITGAVSDYNNWTFTSGGSQTTSTEYITTQFTDLAIAWIGQQQKPWFLWLAYTAPHAPFHLPPLQMHTRGDLPTDQASIDANPLPYFLAMVESLDFELGRLLDSMSAEQRANTVVIFVGDNGTDRRVIQAPYATSQAKGTLYQGGINVPMIISGAGVARHGVHEPALVNLSDLYATILGLAGVNISEIHDSISFEPLLQSQTTGARSLLYSEISGESEIDGWAARDAQYKLMQADGVSYFFDLETDPFETNNLLSTSLSAEAEAAYSAISTEVGTLLDAPTVDGSYSGSWYNPSRDGEGLLIELVNADNPTAVISWYSYQPDGSGGQSWLIGAGPISGNLITADLVLATGGRFGAQFDPAAVSRAPWGSVQLRFSSCTSATLEYSSVLPDYGSGSIELTRATPALLGVVGDCSQ